MKVALDISSMTDGHKVRGIGSYTRELFAALTASRSKHTFVGFSSLREIPSDAEIVHYPYFDPFGALIPLNKKAKIIITVHDFIPLLFPEHFPAGLRGQLQWQMQRLLLPRVDGVIAVSDSTANDCERLTGIDHGKVIRIYSAASEGFANRMSKSEIRTLRERYHLPDRFLLYVGDVTWNKNLPRVVEAAMLSGIHLVMAGRALVEPFDHANKWNSDLIKVEALTKNNDLVQKLGYVSEKDLQGLYQLALLLVMPSLYEGLGFPILEAMMGGCPVLTARKGAIPEIVGDAAYFVDPVSVLDISQGIDAFTKSESRRKKFIEKGLLQSQKFSWQKTAQMTINYYEKVLTR